MDVLPISRLDDRALIRVDGADAAHFLGRVVTADVVELKAGMASAGALLTAQGKIAADFLVTALEDGFLIDSHKTVGADLLKALRMYALRAAVRFEDLSAGWLVLASAGEFVGLNPATVVIRDSRADGLGFRAYVPGDVFTGGSEAYHRRRIGLGVAELGADYIARDLFPHDVGLDQLHGVAFDKGCYVGQEVVSRMQHRGTARRRPVIVSASAELPEMGAPLTVEGRQVGVMGSHQGGEGIAIARLDHFSEALAGGQPVTAGGQDLVVRLPAYASYRFDISGSD